MGLRKAVGITVAYLKDPLQPGQRPIQGEEQSPVFVRDRGSAVGVVCPIPASEDDESLVPPIINHEEFNPTMDE